MRRARPALPLLLLLLAGPLPAGAAPTDPVDECQQQLAVARSVASWIVGGHEAPEGAWPWVVSLQVLRGGVRFVHLCGGVLLSRRAVLTAGHCVDGRTDPCSWRAVLGVHNLQKHSRHTARRRIRRIIVHSEFKRETFENDVAVFELRSAVRYSLFIQPVCLAPAALVQPLENSSDCYISGWGRTTEKGKISPVLKEAHVGILPPSLCNSSEGYAGLMNDKALCAGAWAGGTDTCQQGTKAVGSEKPLHIFSHLLTYITADLGYLKPLWSYLHGLHLRGVDHRGGLSCLNDSLDLDLLSRKLNDCEGSRTSERHLRQTTNHQ